MVDGLVGGSRRKKESYNELKYRYHRPTFLDRKLVSIGSKRFRVVTLLNWTGSMYGMSYAHGLCYTQNICKILTYIHSIPYIYYIPK